MIKDNTTILIIIILYYIFLTYRSLVAGPLNTFPDIANKAACLLHINLSSGVNLIVP